MHARLIYICIRDVERIAMTSRIFFIIKELSIVFDYFICVFWTCWSFTLINIALRDGKHHLLCIYGIWCTHVI